MKIRLLESAVVNGSVWIVEGGKTGPVIEVERALGKRLVAAGVAVVVEAKNEIASPPAASRNDVEFETVQAPERAVGVRMRTRKTPLNPPISKSKMGGGNEVEDGA